MNANFEGKVVVISGAARGIGEAMVRHFLAMRACVVALDRLWDEGSPFYAELQRESMALPLSCDVTSTEAIAAAYTACMRRFGRVDVLINNAAMRQRDLYPEDGASAVLNTKDEHWDRMFAVNVTGAVRLTRAFVQPMLEQRAGSIINVSANGSVTHLERPGVWTGNHPQMLNQPYDASKAAMTSMSFYLAEEVKTSNVAVNVIFPGATRTTGSEEMMQGRAKIGIARPLLEPTHVLALVNHLALQTGSMLTGRAFDAVAWRPSEGVV